MFRCTRLIEGTLDLREICGAYAPSGIEPLRRNFDNAPSLSNNEAKESFKCIVDAVLLMPRVEYRVTSNTMQSDAITAARVPIRTANHAFSTA